MREPLLESTSPLGAEIAEALAADRFVPFFQPQVALSTGRPVGFEALARWRLGDGAMLAPDAFLQAARASGHLGAISARILAKATEAFAARTTSDPLTLSVNVSGSDLERGSLVREVLAALAATGLNPGGLRVELTEQEVLEDPARAAATLAELRAHGITVVLDDFGTGFSSLSWLARLPVDGIKIDKTFVAKVEVDPTAAKIVRALIGLAHDMGLEAIAEGVETQGQQAFLVAHGCGFAQGRLYGMAVPAAEAFAKVRPSAA